MPPPREPVTDLGLIAPHLDVRLAWATQHHLPAGAQAVSEASPSLALWLVHSGNVTILFSETHEASVEQIVLQAGEAILMGTDRKRTIFATRNTDWLSAGFTVRLFSSDATLNLFAPVVRWRPAEKARVPLQLLLEQAAARCREVQSSHGYRTSPFHFCVPDSAVDRWVADGLARGLIATIWEECQHHGGQALRPFDAMSDSGTQAWLLNVLLHVTNHAATATVSEMATIAGISQSQFNRVFRHHMGCTPLTHLNRTRLGLASHLLLTTEHTIEFVARSVGFESLSYFTRLFAREYRETPARFRQVQRSLRL